MNIESLRTFLLEKMSMSEVYQPLIIRELLENSGTCTQDELARALAENDHRVVDYYRSILMRWPKSTLTKHGVIDYNAKTKRFLLRVADLTGEARRELIEICDSKIGQWLEKKKANSGYANVKQSVRYRILKQANGRCELCGVSSSMSPIDIDHIVPQSKADRYGKVVLDGKKIPVHSEGNLQALCFRCNRAKRDTDQTDFRKIRKLVRDKIPEIIRADGKEPIVRQLSGNALINALDEKLMEEHAEYISSKSVDELVDMLEVILELGERKGFSPDELFRMADEKRDVHGGFGQAYFFEGLAH